MTEIARAGWYPAPDGAQAEMFWDGQAWTGSTRTLNPVGGYAPPVRNWWYRWGIATTAAVIGVVAVIGSIVWALLT
jgi:hypothetical protein